MAVIARNGLWFKDGPLSHHQLQILFMVAEFDKGISRTEVTYALFDRPGRAYQERGQVPLSDAQRASLSRSIKRLIDVGLIQRRGDQLLLTENGVTFIASLRQDSAFAVYLKHFGPAWSERGRRAAGLETLTDSGLSPIG